MLVIGAETAELFKNELGIKSLEKADADQTFIAAEGRIGAIRSPYARVELMQEAVDIVDFL